MPLYFHSQAFIFIVEIGCLNEKAGERFGMLRQQRWDVDGLDCKLGFD